MIDVLIRKSGDHYTNFQVKGHAGYAERGKDIVCASVSSLTITAQNALRELTDSPVKDGVYIEKDAWEQTLILVPNDKTDLLIEAYKIGIEGVQEAYPDYVKLHLET